MDITRVKAQLETVGLLQQVLIAAPSGYVAPVNSSADIVSTLEPVVGVGGVYPLTLGDDAKLPNLVYQLAQSNSGEIDGYVVTQTDVYLLRLRCATYDDLVARFAATVAALPNATYEMSITDVVWDYDEKTTAFRANLELTVSYLAADGGASHVLPAAVVYALDRSAGETTSDNKITQRIDNEYSIVLLTKDGNITPLMDAVMDALLGFQQTSEHDEMQYVTGSNLEGVAGLVVWREIYRDAEWRSQI